MKLYTTMNLNPNKSGMYNCTKFEKNALHIYYICNVFVENLINN